MLARLACLIHFFRYTVSREYLLRYSNKGSMKNRSSPFARRSGETTYFLWKCTKHLVASRVPGRGPYRKWGPGDLPKRIQKSIKFRDRFLIDFSRFWSSKRRPKSIKNHEKVTSESLSCSDSVFSWFLDNKKRGLHPEKHRFFLNKT